VYGPREVMMTITPATIKLTFSTNTSVPNGVLVGAREAMISLVRRTKIWTFFEMKKKGYFCALQFDNFTVNGHFPE
jgi:hypothetical protein